MVSRQRNDDDDKKKSGGSSSASSSSSSNSQPTAQQANSYAISLHVNTAMNGAPSGTAIGTTAKTTPVWTSSSSSRWGNGWKLNFGSSGSSGSGSSYSGGSSGSQYGGNGGYQTRGSSAYNQSRSAEPQNATQALSMSTAERFGINGLKGIGNGRPDIRGDKWFAGDTPTSMEIAARILAFDPNNQDAINEMWRKRFTQGDETYSAYAAPTSQAVYKLQSLGVQFPEGGVTREWCEQALSAAAQSGLLNLSSTSGNATSKKRASKDETITYWIAKLYDDLDRTEKAEREWAAFKEDVMHKAGDTSRNWSNEQIYDSLDWSKYPTLRKAIEDGRSQQPSEFVRALDFDMGYFDGLCWAGRNGGGSGDAFTDTVNYILGEGNQYQYDPDKAAKFDINNPEYDPYSQGGTMYNAQLFFGTYDLGDDFVNSHKDYGVSSDSTMSGNYFDVVKANDFTRSCNEELASMKGEVDDWLEDYLKYPNSDPPSDEDITELLNDIFQDNTDYRSIQKLNDSLDGKRPLENTTGVIGTGDTVGLYKRSNLERYIREKLADRASNVDPHDAADETGKGLGGALDSMYSTLGNFFTGLFGPKEQYVPKDENGNPVEVKPEPSKAHVQSSALPPLQELIDQGIAVQTASATVSDVGGALAARPTPTPFPGATPSPEATSAPAPTPAGPTREDWEGARKDSYAAQQEALQKRQNMAQGKFALRETSTPTEKQTYKTSYPEFEDDVTAIKDGIENGSMTEQQGYDSMVQSADALAAKTYFSDVEITEAYQSLQGIIAQEEAQLAGMPDIAGSTMPVNPQTGEPMTEDELIAARIEAQQNGDAERWEYLSKFGAAVQTDEDKRAIANRTAVEESLQQHRIQLAGMQQQYDEAQEHLKGIRAKYDMADEMATEGVETGLGVRATDIMDAIRNGFGEVNLPNWNAWSVYDYAERSGESSQEEIAAAARENIAKDDEGIAQIQGMLDMVDQYGLNIPERYRANMEETLRQYQENKKDSQYYLLRTNPDFAEKVAAADSEEKWGKEKFHTGSSIGYALYAFKHGTKDRQLYAQYPLMGEMSQEELDTALYLLETQGPITADEYYLHLGDSQYGRLNTRFTEDAVQQAVGIAKGSAVGGTLLSVAMAPLNSTGSFQIIFDKVTGRKSNPNSILSAGQKASAAMRQEAKGQIVGAIADPFGGADSAVGKVAGFVYDGITSAGDTAANLAVGKALGIVGTPLDNKLKVSAMNMATAAGTSSYNEAIQKGGTEEQATMMGIASFMGEWLTEAIEMTDIMNAISTGASEAAEGAVKGIKAFLKKQIPELGNEVVGESVSDVIERVSDEAIMGELSDKAKAVEGYTQALMEADPNMTEQLARSEAEYQAKLDGWKSTAYAGLQGGFSAGISTTGGYVAGNFATTTDQFLRTFAVQRGLEAQGLPKANARVAARNIVAVGADNTTVYGPQLNAELAENEAQMAAEEAAAEDLNRRTHEFAEDLNSDAAREEQNNLRQANAEQQTSETEQPTSEEQNNTATAIRSTRQVATSEQSRANRAEFSRRMFALEQGSMGGATQQVVAITSVLDQGETSSDELTTAQARAAAQGLVETFGDRATSVIQRLMMRARTEGVDYGALAQAVQVAGLTDGAANQVFAGLQPWGISTENFNAFMQAANADMADQAIRDQMRKRTYDVMIAAEKARLISEGAAKDLQAAAERKQEARKRRQYAQEQHEAKVREVEAANANLNRTNEEFDNGIDGDTENALRDAASDLPGAIIAERQLAQSEENAIANEAKVNKETKAQQEAISADLTRQAQEAVDRKLKAAYATRDRRSAVTAAQGQAVTGNSGTVFVNPKTKISFHYAIVPVEALVTSNTDNGGVNPDYPAKLQPRDRTRYSSRVDLEDMANGGLTPELLGADNRVQHGAPVVGPDFIVESGNQRTMGIRKAMQNGKANGYTEWLRTNAENFGFAPDVVTDNSVLVRVRDTDIDRVAFAREANTVDMAKLSPSETAAVDADMLTPERMALFVPNDDGRVDNEDNREFVRMYRQEIIPEYERGSYQNDKGENANDLYNRIKRGLFNRAYHDRILTAAVTESTGDEVKNVMTAMTNVAPKVALVADGIANGNLYDLDVTQNIVDAAKLIRDIRRDGISLDERLNQDNMFEEGIDPTTAAIAQMFDTNKRSGTKITRALNNILDDIINLGAPDQVRLGGMEMTEAPDKAQFVQSSLNRTAGVVELESKGAVEGQTSMLGNDTAAEETQAYIRSDVDNLPSTVTQNFESLDVAPDVYFRGTEDQISEAQAKEDQRKQEFRDIINNDTFMALEYTLPDGRKQILHRSARDGVGFQLSYIGSDGIPTMHENYIRTGNTSVNEAIHSEEELLNHLVRENLRKPLSVTIQYAPDSETQAYIAPSTQTTQQTTQQTAQPKNSPYAIANNLMSALGIGNYNGTRKMVTRKNGKLQNQPKSVLGYYNTRAKYIAARPNEAGNYFTTMHEIGHAIADRIGMTGTQQMVANLDPAFAAGYKNKPNALPGEAFAEFFRQYMESEAQARAFAGDQFVDDFQRAIEDAGIADTVQNACDELRNYVSADIHTKVQAVIRDRSDKPATPLSKVMQAIAFRTDRSSAAEKVAHVQRKQANGDPIPLMADIRRNALMQNFASRVASNLIENLLTDADGNIIGDGLGVKMRNAGVHGTEGFELLNEYMLLIHSLDRDAEGKPVFDILDFPEQERRARISEIEVEHPEIKRGAEAFQQWRTDFMEAWLVDTGMLSQDVLDDLNTIYPFYVPTQRVLTGTKVADGISKSAFKIRAATGSTMDIINPMDTWCEMVTSIVNTVKANKTALAWHNAYQMYQGLGEFGREITPDKRKTTVDTTSVQDAVEKLLSGNVSDDVMQDVLDAIGTEQSQWITENGSRVNNAIAVTLEDGSKAYYQILDGDLFKLLSNADSGRGEIVRLASKTLGRMTKGMSALTTGSNPVFAVRNFLRDYQNSVNYGSWAVTYLDGFPKWLAAAYQVWTKSGDYKQYQALGGGGWTRIDTGTQESTKELRGKIVEGYGSEGVGNKAKAVRKGIWGTITFEKLNEVIEQTSRFAEYEYGKDNRQNRRNAKIAKQTGVGIAVDEDARTRAFLAAQDVTVDFARQGYGDIVPTLKQVIPFFGASLQGVYRTGRMLTEGERSRLPARFAKTVFNTALASALSAGFILKFGSDDEKEAFENMSDDLKAGHFYLPNFAPHIFGKYPLIRVPLAQDPLTYAVHNIVTNAAWNGTTDQDIIDILATANTILDNINPMGNPVWQAIEGVQNNRNWYGSKIIPTRLENLPASAQYTSETADIFVGAGRVLNMSPLNLQYLAEQYTGFVGQMLIPAISKDENTGELGGWKAAINAAQRRLTTDPLVSTDATNTFYDGYNLINGVVQTVSNEQPLNQLRRGLSTTQARKAYDDAYKLTHKGGKLYDTKKKITDYYNQIDKINGRQDLTDGEKYTLTTDVRRKMIREVLRANEVVEDYRQKYMTGDDIATKALFEGARIKNTKK